MSALPRTMRLNDIEQARPVACSLSLSRLLGPRDFLAVHALACQYFVFLDAFPILHAVQMEIFFSIRITDGLFMMWTWVLLVYPPRSAK